MADVKWKQQQQQQHHTQTGEELNTEDPELKQDMEEFPFHIVTVKSEDEDDEAYFSEFHQRLTEENTVETYGEDCGAEAGCSSDPLSQFHSDSEEDTDISENTDHSEDYSQQQAPAKRSYAMIPPDANVLDQRPFTCSDCERRFQRKTDLMRHMRTHTVDKSYLCSDCDKSFSQKAALKRHNKHFHKICPVCSKQFQNKLKLNKHLRTLHPDSAMFKDIQKPYGCSECGKRFQHYSILQNHIKVHFGEGPFQCPNCGKRFGSESHLQNHLKYHTGRRPFKCSVCDDSFTSNPNLKKHMKIHTKQGPVLCSVCGRRFKNKRPLSTHMQTHRGKPFLCSVCENSFVQQCDLTSHQKLAHHICPVCTKAFTDRDSLKEHLKTHIMDGTLDPSSDQVYSCTECGELFFLKVSFQRHMRKTLKCSGSDIYQEKTQVKT